MVVIGSQVVQCNATLNMILLSKYDMADYGSEAKTNITWQDEGYMTR